MSLFSALGKLVKPLGKVVNNPLVQLGASFIPGGGLLTKGLSVAAGAATAYGAYNAIRGSSAPAPAGGLPPLPGTNSPGILPRGPGGGLQMPWNDASPDAQLKPYTIDDRYLKVSYRAPKGYVVMWDGGAPGVGHPFAILKSAAKNLRYHNGHKVFRHHAKPPISVGEYHSLKKAHKTIKKVHKIHGLISYVHSNTTEAGKVKVHKHHKKGHVK